MIGSVKTPAVGATQGANQTEGAQLQVDLAAFIALSVPQKELYLSALVDDPRFAEVLPRLQAVLAKEASATKATAPVAANDSPTVQGKGIGASEIAGLFEQVQVTGYGNSEFWAKVTSDLVRTVHAFAPFVQALSERETGSLRQSLQGLASNLANTSAGGYGGSDFWSARAGTARDVIHDVARQLRALDGVSTARVPPKETLLMLAGVAESITSGGRGDVDYWNKSSATAAYTAQLVGVGVTMVATSLSEPDRTVIKNLGDRLRAIASEGYGDADFWAGKTASVVQQAHDLAKGLRNAAGAMA